jgi:arylsulfatase A-like enzyme
MHDYLGCIKAVDESVGKLLKYLDDEGLADNTLVVYSADQGFYLGEHGWFDKRLMYEESLRMPLIVRSPPEIGPGSTTATSSSTSRLAATRSARGVSTSTCTLSSVTASTPVR